MFALAGMLLYPAVVMATEIFDLHQAATILGDMAAVYFVSVAGIVAAFSSTSLSERSKWIL